jgi:hypothetical protein
VFLHVGCPKTGTTFLQEVLWSQRDLAREQGLLLPLASFFDHYLASLDVRALSGRPPHPPRAVGMWQRLAEQAAEWRGDVLVSHELFAAATAEQATRAVEVLGDAEVHVVVTARDLVRQIPAEWQEHVKHRSPQGFTAFVDDLMKDVDGRSWFWQVQDVPAVLTRWGAGLPKSQVHVVVVPPVGADPGQLWRRFAGLLGIDGSGFALDRGRSNTSLGAEQVELLRRVNDQLGTRLPIPGPYPGVVKNVLAHQVLAARPGTPYALTGDAYDFAVQRSKEMAQVLDASGVDVVGDLSELVPQQGPDSRPRGGLASAVGPDAVTDDVLLGESVAALAGLLDAVHQDRRRLEAETERRVAEALGERDRVVAEMTQRPVRHLLKGLSLRWPWLMRLRMGYRRLHDAERDLRARVSRQDPRNG